MKEASQLTLFAEDSPARTSPTREPERELKASAAAYGQSMPDLLASFDRNSSSWRTSQHCLVEGLTVFSETWPRSGMMRNGIAYQLQPLVRLTDETASGSWPTPRSCSSMAATLTPKLAAHKYPNLETVVARTLWPTPTASMGGPNNQSQSVRAGKHGINLAGAVRMVPTPTAQDWKDGRKPYDRKKNGTKTQDTLGRLLASSGETANGTLNPTWVEWLMGFPLGWTDLNN